MRVFCATFATETNTFGPLPTGLASFREFNYYPAGKAPEQATMFSGPLWAARKRATDLGWTLIEGMVAEAMPSGRVTRHAFETLKEELLQDLIAAMPLDIVLLGLHGAMVADGYDDCEGDLLRHIRALVGPDAVIGAELDPHCHLSEDMIRNADILITFKEYPHTDIFDRADELIDLSYRVANGMIRPVAAAVDCNIIVPIHTSREPARGMVDAIKALEGKDGILSVSIAHGFAWGDVPDMGTKVLVYADGDKCKAEALAERLAREITRRRSEFGIGFVDIEGALDEAMKHTGRPVVIADGADNAGGGAASDSTHFLGRILARSISNVALGPIWDPVAVQIAFEAGSGAQLPIRIGGKIGPLSGNPMDLPCKVKAVRENMFMRGLAGIPMALGNCALVETCGVEIVLTTLRHQAMDIDLFTQLGCALQDKAIIVVKSAQHFYASFSQIAGHIIYASAPGVVTQNLSMLDYSKIARPKWPIDDFAP